MTVLIDAAGGSQDSAGLPLEPWLNRVDALAETVAEWRDIGERERRMPEPLFEGLRDAGLFRMAVPAAFGGAELAPEYLVRVIEALARRDGAVGWNVMIAANSAAVMGLLPAAAEIYARGSSAVTAGSARPLPTNTAQPVREGYGVNAYMPLASGCHQADWAAALCFVRDNGTQRLAADGTPELILAVMPMAQCEILDTWYTTGLRGTGSNDVRAIDVFVPAARCLAVRFAGPNRVGQVSLRQFQLLSAPEIAAVALGIARSAIDSFTELAGGKVPHGSTTHLGKQHTAHEHVGEAEALVRSAQAYLYRTVREVTPFLQVDMQASDGLAADVRLACANAARSAAHAVDLMFTAGGISATYASNRLDRCFRDVHMTTQHVAVAGSNFEMVGQFLLGGDLQARR